MTILSPVFFAKLVENALKEDASRSLIENLLNQLKTKPLGYRQEFWLHQTDNNQNLFSIAAQFYPEIILCLLAEIDQAAIPELKIKILEGTLQQNPITKKTSFNLAFALTMILMTISTESIVESNIEKVEQLMSMFNRVEIISYFYSALTKQTPLTIERIYQLFSSQINASDRPNSLVQVLIKNQLLIYGIQLCDADSIDDEVMSSLVICFKLYYQLKKYPDSQAASLALINQLGLTDLMFNESPQSIVWTFIEAIMQQFEHHLSFNLLWSAHLKLRHSLPQPDLSIQFFLPSLNRLLLNHADSFYFAQIRLRQPNPIDAALTEAAIYIIIEQMQQFIQNNFDKSSEDYIKYQIDSRLISCTEKSDTQQLLMQLERLEPSKTFYWATCDYQRYIDLLSAARQTLTHHLPCLDLSISMRTTDGDKSSGQPTKLPNLQNLSSEPSEKGDNNVIKLVAKS